MRTKRLIWLQVDKKVTDLLPLIQNLSHFIIYVPWMVLVFFLEQFFKETHWCVLCVWIEVVLPAFIGTIWFPCPQWNYKECPCLLSMMTWEHANVLLSVINLNGQELGISSRVARLKGTFVLNYVCAEMVPVRWWWGWWMQTLADWQISELKSLVVIIPCYVFDWIHIFYM